MSERVFTREPHIKHAETVKYETNQKFYDQMKTLQYLNNPINDLAKAPSAIVYFGTPCCDLRCCVPLSCLKCVCSCEDNYRYTTLINNGSGVSQFLFKNWATLSCSILGLSKECRYKTCRSLTFSSYDDYENDGGTQFCEMVKNTSCTCFGLCSLLLNVVVTADNNRLAGIVKYRGYCEELFSCKDCCKARRSCCAECVRMCQDLCYDYYYCCEILSPSGQTVYYIFLRKCCLSCVPVDCCNEIIFTIKAPDYANVGEIKATRNCCSLCGACGTNFTYSINFPEGAIPDLKLTIINAVISIDMFIL